MVFVVVLWCSIPTSLKLCSDKNISEKERRRVTSLLLLFKVLMTALGASSYLYHL